MYFITFIKWAKKLVSILLLGLANNNFEIIFG